MNWTTCCWYLFQSGIVHASHPNMKNPWCPSFGLRHKEQHAIVIMVGSFSKSIKVTTKLNTCTPCCHFHTRLMPHFLSNLGAFFGLYSQCKGIQCCRLNMATYNYLWNNVWHNTHCLCCTMDEMKHWWWHMWGHVPKTHPLSSP